MFYDHFGALTPEEYIKYAVTPTNPYDKIIVEVTKLKNKEEENFHFYDAYNEE